MSTEALYHCVCGEEFPIEGPEIVTCSGCGRACRPGKDGGRSSETVSLPLGSSTRTVFDEDREAGSADTVHAWNPPERSPSLTGRDLDHFEILEEIGHGGMGTVYRALDRSLERFVAVKVISSEDICRDRDHLDAFVHEARAQARINHPGIVTIYYIGHLDEKPYFAMELLTGTNLEQRVRRDPLPFAEVIDIGLQVVSALREANARGVVHRDIKPANVLLADSGRVKVTDFGLSKTEKGGVRITGTHTVTGTPYYLAPEQARGESTNFRTDIYSLGATLYHLAYGRPPFDGENFMAVISKHLGDALTFPTSPPEDIPPGFRSVVDRMMAKLPKDRFQSYEELEDAIEGLKPEHQISAAPLRRMVASGIDYFVFLVLYVLAHAAVPLADRWVRLPETLAVWLFWGFLAAAAAYQVIAGTSLGKVFGHLRIAHIAGRPVPGLILAVRFVFQFLPVIWLATRTLQNNLGIQFQQPYQDIFIYFAVLFPAVDFVWSLTNRRHRSLHDYLLRTRVLEAR